MKQDTKKTKEKWSYVTYSTAIVFSPLLRRWVPKVMLRIERSSRSPKEEKSIAKWWEGTKGEAKR